MRQIALTLACLFCAGHGRQLQNLGSSPRTESSNVPIWQSDEHTRTSDPLKMFASFLALHSSAAFVPSSSGIPASLQHAGTLSGHKTTAPWGASPLPPCTAAVCRSPVVALKADPFDVPRPDPQILISSKTDDEQKLWFAGINAGLLTGTAVLVSVLTLVENVLPPGWFGTLGNLGTIPLGLIFVAIGAAHFAQKEAFLDIVPPIGTWGGLWQVPAPGADELGLSYAEYHTYWSGVAEIGGGLLLAASGVGLVPMSIQRIDAFLMLLLTLAVTPANIYMATHDAQMGEKVPPMKYPDSHVVRGVLQVVFLADFWKLSFH